MKTQLRKVIVKITQWRCQSQTFCLWKTYWKTFGIELAILNWWSWEVIEYLRGKFIFRRDWIMWIHGTGTCQTTKILNILLKAWKFGCETDVKVTIVLVAFIAVETCTSVELENRVGMSKTIAISKLYLLSKFLEFLI